VIQCENRTAVANRLNMCDPDTLLAPVSIMFVFPKGGLPVKDVSIMVVHLAIEMSIIGLHVKIAIPTDHVWMWRDAFPLASNFGLFYYSHCDDRDLLLEQTSRCFSILVDVTEQSFAQTAQLANKNMTHGRGSGSLGAGLSPMLTRALWLFEDDTKSLAAMPAQSLPAYFCEGHMDPSIACPIVFVTQKFLYDQWENTIDLKQSSTIGVNGSGLLSILPGSEAVRTLLEHHQRWKSEATNLDFSSARPQQAKGRQDDSSFDRSSGLRGIGGSVRPIVKSRPYLLKDSMKVNVFFSLPKSTPLDALQHVEVVTKEERGLIAKQSERLERSRHSLHLTWVVRIYAAQERNLYDFLWGLVASLAACEGEGMSVSLFLLDTEIGYEQPEYLEKCKTFFRHEAQLDVRTFLLGDLRENLFRKSIKDGGCARQFMGNQAQSNGQVSGNCQNFAQYVVTDEAVTLALRAVPETTHVVVTNADNLYSLDFFPAVKGILNPIFLKGEQTLGTMVAMRFYHHSTKSVYKVSNPLMRRHIDLGGVVLPASLFTVANMSFIKTLPENASEMDAHDADGFFIETVQHMVAKLAIVSHTLFYHL